MIRTKTLRSTFSSLSKDKLFIAIIVYFIYGMAVLFWSPHPHLNKIFQIFFFMPMMLIAFKLFVQKPQIRTLVYSFQAGLVLSILLSYGIVAEFWTLKGSPSNPVPFNSYIQFSLYLAFSALLFLYDILHETNLKRKLLFTGLFILVVIDYF